jgi:beta-phosphoglucomutase-like phosphatase (HAD superfamily)
MTRLPAGHAFDVDAVLFDMDGTLVDSTAVVVRLWRRWAARHDVPAGVESIAREAPLVRGCPPRAQIRPSLR